jgi:ribonuclease HI
MDRGQVWGTGERADARDHRGVRAAESLPECRCDRRCVKTEPGRALPCSLPNPPSLPSGDDQLLCPTHFRLLPVPPEPVTPTDEPSNDIESAADRADTMKRVQIHADESCLGNQFKGRANPGGAAGLVEYWTGSSWIRRDYWLSELDTTNNRMAILSGIEGLRLLTRPCEVRFVSDSQYLVKGMREWLPGWRRRGWKRKAGPIENLDLWKRLSREAERHRLEWVWVRGHDGHARNEYANDLAVAAAKEQTSSGGLQPSGFESWLNDQRERRGRFLDFYEFAGPDSD